MKSSLSRLTTVVCVAACLSMAACASLPSQFANENPPLSTADQNIVIAAATIRQDLPTGEMVVETAAPLVLAELASQPATQARDGLLLFDLGEGLAGVTGTGTISTSIVSSTASSLNTSLSTPTDNIIQAIINDAQAPINNELTQLNSLANSATNPDVKAYVLATIPMVVNGVGVALETSFGSYAPTPAETAALEKRKAYIARIHENGKNTILAMAYNPDLSGADLRHFIHD